MLYSIQFLRGIAALLVVLTHSLFASLAYGNDNSFLMNYYNFGEFGGVGVDIFFVISGFIMAYVTRNDNVTLKKFAFDRAIRVIPLYWFFLTVMLCIFLFLPTAFKNNELVLWNVVASYLFLPSYKFDGSISPLLGVGWTLNYEMFYYFFFAAFLSVNREKRFVFVSMSFVGLSILGIIFQFKSPILFVFTNPIILEFCLGMFLFNLYNHKLLCNRAISIVVLVIALFIFYLTIIYGIPSKFDIYRVFVFGLPSFLLMYSLISLEVLGLKFSSIICFIGKISFSLYLSHYFVVRLMSKVFEQLNIFKLLRYDDISTFIIILFSIVFGGLVYFVIENPLNVFFRNTFKTKVKCILN